MLIHRLEAWRPRTGAAAAILTLAGVLSTGLVATLSHVDRRGDTDAWRAALRSGEPASVQGAVGTSTGMESWNPSTDPDLPGPGVP